MNHFPFEPNVRVGLCEDSPFGLKPEGEFQISASDSQIIYTPAAPNAEMLVKGMTIGHNFHWQQKRDLRFKGAFIVMRKQDKSCLINVIKAEEYLKSVICSEMSADAPLEYLKAHAVISRSWLMRILSGTTHKASDSPCQTELISWTQNDLHKDFDVCADDHCQRYQGIADLNELAAQAVEETRSLVLTTTEGEIADTRFSKCCGGHTERFSTAWDNIDLPYLPAQVDPHCNPEQLTDNERLLLRKCLRDYDAETSFYMWDCDVPRELIRSNIIRKYGRDIGSIQSITPLERGESGRISRLRIEGTQDTVVVGKELTIRSLLSTTHLYSSAFDVLTGSDGFHLRGRGWGHGVGLCQTGAAVMAIRGATAREILSFYFPNTHLSSLYD